MPKSKSRRKKPASQAPKKKLQATQKAHPDWHLERRQQVASSFIPNQRTKQNANWEKRT